MTRLQLADEVLRHTPCAGFHETAVPCLRLYRQDTPNAGPTAAIYERSICVIAQGSKQLIVGDATLGYDTHHYLVSALPLPLHTVVPKASPEEPFLGFVVRFDPVQVATLVAEIDGNVTWSDAASSRAIEACPLNDSLAHALSRLVRCLDDDLDRQILGDALVREILYSVLRGPKGHVLRGQALQGSRASQVARAIAFVEKNFRQPLDVQTIAKHAAMGPSALHQHFKRLTALSPMQYVQQLRLHEARALLLSGTGVAESGFAVGYNSPSQFSREFRRLFGVPPSQVVAA